MDENSKKTVVHQLIEEFLTTGKPDMVGEVLAANYIDHSPSNPELAGLENIKQFVNERLMAFPGSHSVVKDMVAEGDKVAVRWTITATHKG